MIKAPFISPVLANSNVPPIALGKPDTIPAKIIMEIPFPIPRSVTCSPNHIKKTVPVTNVIVVIATKAKPGFKTTDSPPAV